MNTEMINECHIEIDGEAVRFPTNNMKIRFMDVKNEFGDILPGTGYKKADAYATRHFPIEYAEGRVTITNGLHPKAAEGIRMFEKGVLA